MEIRICLFDDSPKVIEAVTMLMDMVDGMRIVSSYHNPENVVERVLESRADLVIMDIDMPHINGISAIRTLRDKKVQTPVLMFTVLEDDDHIFDAICAGANGYLLKNIEPMKMVDAIRETLNGGAPMSPGIARKVLQKFALQNQNEIRVDYQLTAREQEILRLLTQGKSYKMIADDCSISFETVRTHIKNIYSKLHVASMTEAVAKALNEKLV
ncbi:MAG: response regulator transcription factor [Bacteroidia bacterium]|jgi:DNA-binding NarL/FixJ family response regulator